MQSNAHLFQIPLIDDNDGIIKSLKNSKPFEPSKYKKMIRFGTKNIS